MYCPECKAEYRRGFTRCSDCDVDLVDALPSDGPDDLTTIWMGDDQDRCVEMCQELKDAGIPYEASPEVKSGGMRVKWRFTLSVTAEDVKKAKELLGLSEIVAEEDSDAPEPEPDEEEALPAPPEDEERAPREQRRRSSYLGHWYPEDATVEVWRETPDFRTGSVEMSLKENQIRARVEVQENGLKRLFVMPEDEAEAREIVREIVEGTPPE